MRARRARASIALACLIAAVAVAACGSGSTSEETGSSPRIDLVVGDILPLTGSEAGLGVSAEKAGQLAVEKINDAIGDTGLDDALEIVHEDESRGGAARAVRALIATGSGCIIGPGSAAAAAEITAIPAAERRAVLIYPHPVAPPPGPGPAVVVLPAPDSQVVFSSEPSGGQDPVAAFASLYESTDPPIGPARTSDGRQFDAVVLCYLAAVAAGSAEPSMARSLAPPRAGWPAYSWQQLDEAILSLGAGKPIVYAGITGRFGVAPPGRQAPAP